MIGDRTHTEKTDIGYMERALQLAAQGRGRTSPNPMVGAVIVRDGRVVGEGFHEVVGGPHAEVIALKEAGGSANGATMYVSLEPCCHQGRTPPCVPRVIESGVRRVVVGLVDPYPLVNGLGIQMLRDAGLEVTVMDEPHLLERCARLNEVFIKYVVTQTPFVTMKYAMTLDGKIATRTGESKWISGSESRAWVHHERSLHDAIMVGVGTVIADDPHLTAHQPEARDPIKIIVDSKCRIPPKAKVLDHATSRVIVATTEQAPPKRVKAIESKGVQVLPLPSRDERVSLPDLMAFLRREHIASVLLEGGGTLNAAAVADGIVDKVVCFVAPILLGGSKAKSPVEGSGVPHVDEAWHLEEMTFRPTGSDIRIEGYLRRPWTLLEKHSEARSQNPE